MAIGQAAPIVLTCTCLAVLAASFCYGSAVVHGYSVGMYWVHAGQLFQIFQDVTQREVQFAEDATRLSLGEALVEFWENHLQIVVWHACRY